LVEVTGQLREEAGLPKWGVRGSGPGVIVGWGPGEIAGRAQKAIAQAVRAVLGGMPVEARPVEAYSCVGSDSRPPSIAEESGAEEEAARRAANEVFFAGEHGESSGGTNAGEVVVLDESPPRTRQRVGSDSHEVARPEPPPHLHWSPQSSHHAPQQRRPHWQPSELLPPRRQTPLRWRVAVSQSPRKSTPPQASPPPAYLPGRL
jgi:hypothetical protein